MFNYIWRDKISLNLEITHVTFSLEPRFHPYFFLSLYYMCQALSKRFSGITSLIPWMITIPVFLQGLGNLFPGTCWGVLDLRQGLQDPCPHLLYRQTPDNDQSSPSLELHTPSSTDAHQSTRLPHRHFKSNSSKPEIFPFVFPDFPFPCSTTPAMVVVGAGGLPSVWPLELGLHRASCSFSVSTFSASGPLSSLKTLTAFQHVFFPKIQLPQLHTESSPHSSVLTLTIRPQGLSLSWWQHSQMERVTGRYFGATVGLKSQLSCWQTLGLWVKYLALLSHHSFFCEVLIASDWLLVKWTKCPVP